MKAGILFLLTLTTVACHAAPKVEFSETDKDAVEVIYYNDTGMPIRSIVILEELVQDTSPHVADESRWKLERRVELSEGFNSALKKGRRDPISKELHSALSQYRRTTNSLLRLRVILEWRKGDLVGTDPADAKVFYYTLKNVPSAPAASPRTE